MDDEVRASIEQVIEYYRSIGYQTKEVSLPTTDLSIPVYYVIATAKLPPTSPAMMESATPHAVSVQKMRSMCMPRAGAKDLDPRSKRRCILGAYALSSGYYDAYYLRAQKARTLIRQDFEKAFAEVDAILTPTSPHPRLSLGEK